MKLIGLLSGGIDSPVAIHLMQRQGAQVMPVHFDNFYGKNGESPGLEKVASLARTLGLGEVIVVPHADSLHKFQEKAEARFTCVFCKRLMLRVCERLAEKLGAEAIVTGDSLGQVASQTPENLAAENAAVKLPILRPLIGMNKGEIISIARKIGSFSPSIEKAPPCPFVPPQARDKSERKEA